MANRFANPSPQFFDNSGEPLSGGLLYFYVTATSTPATTYSDDDLTTPNTNPVVLDSAGRAGNIFLDPTVVYKAVLKSGDGGTTFWTRDPVVDPAANVAASVAVYNGDPNGFVAGNAGSVGGSGASLVYDITNERLYVCITTGNAAAAVWQYIYDPISGQEDVRTADHTVTAANRGRTQVANKASAITFTLPAAATIGAGFVVPVKNIGAGALTIDGNASETIDGATTITLGQYESAILYCNGAAWRTVGRSEKPAKGYLHGLTLSSAPSVDVTVAAGEATDSTGTSLMVLASSLTKVINAAWAVGAGQGMRDTGSLTSGWWYIFLIRRSDTGVVDVLASLSATSPTMPANYDQKRRIGAVYWNSATIVPFKQNNDQFLWDGADNEGSTSNPGTSAVIKSLTTALPLINILADITVIVSDTTPAAQTAVLVTSPLQSDNTPSAAGSVSLIVPAAGAGVPAIVSGNFLIPTEDGTVRYRLDASNADISVRFIVNGWYDSRGRLS